MQVELETYEMEALISWHLDQQFDLANREEYADAEWHKKRTAYLRTVLNDEQKKTPNV